MSGMVWEIYPVVPVILKDRPGYWQKPYIYLLIGPKRITGKQRSSQSRQLHFPM